MVDELPQAEKKPASAEKLTQKAIFNAFAYGADHAVRVLVTIILTPILVTYLGDFSYGVWQMLSRVTGYISSASARPSQALKWIVSREQHSADYESKRNNVSSAVIVWVIFLPVVLIIGGILAWFAPFYFKAPTEQFFIIRLSSLILLLNLILANLVEIPREVLQGENLAYKRIRASTLLLIVNGVLIYFGLRWGLVGISIATLIGSILTGIMFLVIVKQSVRWFGYGRPAMSAIRDFFKLSSWFMLSSLVFALVMDSDVLVLGLVNSTASVTPYTLTKYAAQMIIIFINITLSGAVPGISGIIGSGNKQRGVALYGEITLLSWLLCTTAGATVVLWNADFVSLWTNPQNYSGDLSSLLLVVSFMQLVFIRNDLQIIQVTLDLKAQILFGILSLSVSFITSWVAIAQYDLGITGLCVGYVIGQLVLNIAYPFIIANYFGHSIWAWGKMIIRPIVVTILLLVGMLYLENYVAAPSWLHLIFFGGVTFALLLPLLYLLGLPSTQKQLINRRISVATSRFR